MKSTVPDDLLDQACLYVLGLLERAPRAVFENETRRNSTLRGLVAQLNNALLILAELHPPRPLPPSLRVRLLRQILHRHDNFIARPNASA
jgi:anti-sigma-K factor RskA